VLDWIHRPHAVERPARESVYNNNVGMLQNENSQAASLPSSEPAPPAPRTESHPDPPAARAAIWGALSWARDLAFSILIAVILIVFIYQPVKVEGTSMMPTLTDQERIFINKFTYHYGLGEIQRGDMVVFWYPLDTSKSYIKRIIGVPGDTIKIADGDVYVNGKRLIEDYVPDINRDRNSWGPKEVPADRYFVLGDHRNSSNDSRNWGFVERKYIYGKAVFVYWPLDKMGRLK
jgi:signal peptidase I